MKLLCCILVSGAVAVSATAQTYRLFGSVGGETLLTPANTASSLNPRNIAGIDYQTNSGDAVLFAEASTEDRTWKVATKLRGEWNDQIDDTASIAEAYVRWNANAHWSFTAGRVIEKWGAGYAWNPAAFISPRKNPSDPNDRRSAYEGRDMLKVESFLGSTALSLYALENGESALRAYRLIGGTDVSLYVDHRDGSTTPGASLSRVFGDALELHAEGSRRKLLIGGQYTFPNGTNIITELYRSGEGLNSAEWSRFVDDASGARTREQFIDANRRFRPLEMAQNYSFVRAARDWERTKLTTELLVITNLRDGSSIVRATITKRLHGNFTLSFIDTEFAADGKSEMSFMQIRRSTSFAARFYF
jgi:hypothetical protein